MAYWFSRTVWLFCRFCVRILSRRSSFFFHYPAPPEIYTLSLHDALPISSEGGPALKGREPPGLQGGRHRPTRSEEHTSELQSPCNLVCRLLLEKKKPVHINIVDEIEVGSDEANVVRFAESVQMHTNDVL